MFNLSTFKTMYENAVVAVRRRNILKFAVMYPRYYTMTVSKFTVMYASLIVADRGLSRLFLRFGKRVLIAHIWNQIEHISTFFSTLLVTLWNRVVAITLIAIGCKFGVVLPSTGVLQPKMEAPNEQSVYVCFLCDSVHQEGGRKKGRKRKERERETMAKVNLKMVSSLWSWR